MKNGKGLTRVLAWLLTLVLLVGSMPAAMADEHNQEYVEGQIYYIEDVAYIYISGALVKLTPAPTAAPTPAPVVEEPVVVEEKAAAPEMPAVPVPTEQKAEETDNAATLELPLGPAIAQVEMTEDSSEQIEVTPAPETEEGAIVDDTTAADETEEDAIVEDETAQDEANKPQVLPGLDLSALMPKVGAEKDEAVAAPETADEAEEADEANEPQAGFPGSGILGVLIGKLETVINEDGEEEYTIVPVTPDPDEESAAPVETPAPEEAGDDYGIALLSLFGDDLPIDGCVNGGTHRWVIDDSDVEYGDATLKTESTHTRIKTTTVIAHCTRCEKSGTGTATKEESVEAHEWNGDAVCTVCGYKSECKHTGPKYVDYTVEPDTSIEITYNRNTHNLKGWIITTKTCIECGKVVSEERSGKKTISGPHEFVGGNCYCGYAKGTTCAHENTKVQKEIVSSEEIVPSQWQHTYKGATIYEYILCLDCGVHLNMYNPRISTETERKEDHDFVNGFCTVCGWESHCGHKNGTYPYEEFGAIYNVKSNGSKTHSFTAYVTTYKICRDCGEILSTSTKSNKKFTKNHKFRGGKCIICGAKKGASATSTPEPVYRSDEMVTMLVNAAVRETTNIGVTVEILGTEQILTADEMLRYNALTPQEKVLATFAAIGMEADTAYAKKALDITPAPAAVTLIADIAARQLRMTAEEKAALQATVAEYFPVTTDTLGVKRVQATVSVTNNGSVTAQRYTFRYDSSLKIWLFEKAEAIADEYVGIK